MKSDKTRVIVRRRGKSGHDSPHGAWKIALADFMTTMMALFLVLWVIATATPEQRQGLSDYFSMSLSEAMAGGKDSSGSASAIPGGGPDPTFHKGQRTDVHLRLQDRSRDQRQQQLQRQRMHQLRKRISMAIEASKQLQPIRRQLRFQMTPKGLLIEMVDSKRRPMFELGSDTPMPYMRKLLHSIAPLLNELPNQLSIYGYTDNLPYADGDKGYSNWELSAGRANASRRELVAAGLDSNKLLTVTGVADRITLSGTKPDDPANRRIELLVLTPRAARKIREQRQLRGHPLADVGKPTADKPDPAEPRIAPFDAGKPVVPGMIGAGRSGPRDLAQREK